MTLQRPMMTTLGRIADVQLSPVDKLTNEGEQSVLLCNYVDVYKNHYITSAISFMQATAKPSEITRFSLQKGDVLLTKDSESWDDIGVPAVVTENLPGVVCGYHLAMVRPKPKMAKGRYLFWALMSREVSQQFHLAANGVTRFGIPKQSIRDIEVPLPPLDEQRAIARFLDRKSRRIARFIQARQRMIALLNEQKQAIIHQAVTRGLDADVPLKPSGIDWLGDIPADWEVHRVRSLSHFITSGSRGWSQYYSDDGPVFIRIGNLSTKSIELKMDSVQHVSPPINAEGERTRVKLGDVLISITAQMGAVGYVDGRNYFDHAYVNQHTALIRTDENRVFPDWLALSLISPIGKEQVNRLQAGGTKTGLTLSDVGDLVVLVPHYMSQHYIGAWVSDQHRKIDRSIARFEREIELVSEYRTRLIADVVTGKLDIRDHPDAAEDAPDDPNDTDVLDGILAADNPIGDIEDSLVDEAAG